jgi:hypothetical protein
MKKVLALLIPIVLIFMDSCKKDCDCPLLVSHVVTLQPNSVKGKDAFIEDYPFEDYRNKNWGNSEELAAISWTSGGTPYIVRSFIDFNFDTIPAKAIIDSVKLSLYAHGNIGHGFGHDTIDGSNECYLQRVIEEWDEDLITWNTQPQTTELNQVLIPKSDRTMQNYVSINITCLVKDIYNNIDESHGLMLRLKNEDGLRRRMFFATSDIEEHQKRPKLEIYYSIYE